MRNLVNFAISHALNHANKLVPLESDFTSSFLTGTLFLIPFVCFSFLQNLHFVMLLYFVLQKEAS